MVEFEYAKAVFDIAKENNKVSDFSDCFNAVCETMNPSFMEILDSPFITLDKKKESIDKVYKSLDKDFIYFLYVLVDHGRMDKIKAIYEKYESLVLKDKNILKVELISASELSKAKIKELKDSLAKQYAGMTIEIVNKINPSLIGGVKIVTDEKSMDASVKGTLDKIRETI